jgi:hypothetical protein
MPGQRIANAVAALFVTGSMATGQPMPVQTPSQGPVSAPESFVEILSGPGGSEGSIVLASVNCGCGCSSHKPN